MTLQADRNNIMAELRLALLSGLIDGDVEATEEIVMSLSDAGMAVGQVINDFLRPVQQQLGERWRTGDLNVVDEHLSTAALGTVLDRLSRTTPLDPNLGSVAVTCSEHDGHGLAARFVHAEVRAAGHHAQFLGAQVPPNDLGVWLSENEPELLLLSCSVSTALPGVRRSILAAHAAGVPVVVGGRGLGSAADTARRLGADAAACTVDEALEFVGRQDFDFDAAEASSRANLARAEAVERQRHHLIATALDELEPLEDQHRARICECTRQMVDVAAAAALLDDAKIWTDELSWWRDPSGALRLGRAAGLVGAAVIEALTSRGFADLAATLNRGARPPQPQLISNLDGSSSSSDHDTTG